MKIHKYTFNAAKVIKHMTEKELNEYKITLEKEGPTHPPSIPPWFKPYGEIIEKMAQFMIDQQKFNQDQFKFNQDQLKFNKKQEKNWQDQKKFNKNILKRLGKVDQRLDKLESRIDNLVKKNNLKE